MKAWLSRGAFMSMSTGDLYRLASDLAAEHGPEACDYASRAVMTLEPKAITNVPASGS